MSAQTHHTQTHTPPPTREKILLAYRETEFNVEKRVHERRERRDSAHEGEREKEER